MNSKTMFRVEALEARQTHWLGDIVLIRPVSFTMLTLFFGVLACGVLAFLTWGRYTTRSTVSGQLIPDTGLVKVYSTQSAIIQKKLVTEGQHIRKGDVLYRLSSERQSSDNSSIQASISEQVEARRNSLAVERDKTRLLQHDERDALISKIATLKDELATLDSQISVQERRVKFSSENAARYQGLLAQNYISKEQAQQKQEDLLDQENRLQSLKRDRINVQREYGSQQSDLSTLAIRQANQLAQIERNIESAGQEFTESEAKRTLLVVAPESGTATAVAAEEGQAVDATRPLVSIVPTGATLQAQLYAPSRTVGFIKPGDQVQLRYQAYPYQKFGHAKGTVLSVSRTALPASELLGTGNLQSGAAMSSEPLYRVTVGLARQDMLAYGKAEPLQPGMLLDADILQETLRLYEWVLEPLYSITGKL